MTWTSRVVQPLFPRTGRQSTAVPAVRGVPGGRTAAVQKRTSRTIRKVNAPEVPVLCDHLDLSMYRSGWPHTDSCVKVPALPGSSSKSTSKSLCPCPVKSASRMSSVRTSLSVKNKVRWSRVWMNPNCLAPNETIVPIALAASGGEACWRPETKPVLQRLDGEGGRVHSRRRIRS